MSASLLVAISPKQQSLRDPQGLKEQRCGNLLVLDPKQKRLLRFARNDDSFGLNKCHSCQSAVASSDLFAV